MRMNSLLKRSFAGNSTRFSFLTVSLYGTREKKIKSSCQAFAKVLLFSNSFSILYIENN